MKVRPLLTGLVLTASLAVTGCGSTSQPAAPTGPGGSGAPSDAPVQPKVNRVVLSVPAPGTESNDISAISTTSLVQSRPLYEYLLGIDPTNGKLVAQGATEWQLDESGPSYKFKLRPGVAFHNGGNLTAADVLFSWDYLTQENTLHGEGAYWHKVVKSVEAPAPDQVVFNFNQRDSGFIAYVSEHEGKVELLSKAHFDQIGVPSMQTPPIAGTGPYAFKERAQGQYVRYQRFGDKHWRATPDFPEFEFRWQKEASTRLASLLAGEVHVTNLPEDLMAQAEKNGSKVSRGTVPGLRAFMSFYCCYLKDPLDASKGWVAPESPLMDQRVRKALNKAINRDELNKAFFAGKGELMYLNHYHPTRQGWNPDWERKFKDEYGYDPDASKRLLAEAGFSAANPMSTNVLLSSVAGLSSPEDVSEAIAQSWRNVGAKVELVSIDPAQVTNMRNQYRLTNHATLVGTSSSLFNGVQVYNANLRTPRTGVVDVEVHKLLEEIAVTLDDKKQEELFRRMGDAMFDRQMTVPLFWLPVEAVYNPNFVAGWVFPGSITGSWTHVQNLKAAR